MSALEIIFQHTHPYIQASIDIMDLLKSMWNKVEVNGNTYIFDNDRYRSQYQLNTYMEIHTRVRAEYCGVLHKWPVTRKMFPFDNVIMCWDERLEMLVLTTQNR